jgi:pilus assembly protein TadC
MRRACSRARAGQAHLESLRDEASAACSLEGARFAAVFEAGERLGVPMASALRALAEEISDTNRARAAEATRAASLKVLIPLGVLILPAFVLACLVPLFLNGLRGLPL